MTTFVDSSALYALLDEGDHAHDIALAWLEGVSADAPEPLCTHNYVVSETIALTHARLGAAAVRSMTICTVEPSPHTSRARAGGCRSSTARASR
jgi:predicted nucleic acid-binding protein